MKRMIALVAALLLLLMLCSGCKAPDAADVSENNAIDDLQAQALYAPLIDAYREAIENYDYDSYDLDINFMTIDYYHYFGNMAGYTVFDINRDGTPELIIGEKDDDEQDKMRPEAIDGIYTLQDGAPKWLLGSVDEYSLVSVLKDGRILEWCLYWGKAIESGNTWNVFELKDGALSRVKTYFGVEVSYDEKTGTAEYTNCYSTDNALPLDKDGEVLTDEMQPMEPSAFAKTMTALKEAKVKLPITLFSE